ncbi:hypothetical protein SAY86_008151 [Trapa natans]|uniref:Target of Myb protein 1 n=1 Tax=Trapa natans TaxID=22666 RepID=A0AAN7KD97_TRANT|nr:hypothetical protein SAY86_008151 [Trapa natans]
MAAELVNSATSDKLAEMDWMKNIEICEMVARDKKATKDVIKAIKKRLGSANPNTQLYAVLLLEMLMNNIGEKIHEQVIESRILPILVKIVKKKTDFPVREKIFLLLDATQTSVGGSSGKFPQYYSAYYDLVSAGVKFPQRPHASPLDHPTTQTGVNRQAPTLQAGENVCPLLEVASSQCNGFPQQPAKQPIPESSIIQKASNALEVLKEVLDVVDPQHPAAAKDEFTLDLVEQCSFHKHQVMHLVITSRDEKIISQAIELNDQLQKVLARHDALVSGGPISSSNHVRYDDVMDEEEEEPEQLFRRMRKGKACMRPENEGGSAKRLPPTDLYEAPFPIPAERLNRPLIRPLSLEPNSNTESPHPPAVIPPPPAKHVEREKFFKENMLHSCNPSSSGSDSLNFRE